MKRVKYTVGELIGEQLGKKRKVMKLPVKAFIEKTGLPKVIVNHIMSGSSDYLMTDFFKILSVLSLRLELEESGASVPMAKLEPLKRMKNEPPEEFLGRSMRKRRIELRLTFPMIKELSGVNSKTLSAIENGKPRVRMSHVLFYMRLLRLEMQIADQ